MRELKNVDIELSVGVVINCLKYNAGSSKNSVFNTEVPLKYAIVSPPP